MSAHLKPVPGPAAYSDEWFALRLFDPERTERPVVFGASMAAMVVENPLELYMRMTRRLPPQETTEDMEVGLLMEPVVLEMYKRRSGHKIATGLPIYFHPEYPFIAGTPDAIGANEVYLSREEYIQNGWVVDAKTSHDRMFLRDLASDDLGRYGAEETDLVPSRVLWQMQQLCCVFDHDHADVPVLFGRKYRFYRVYRDQTLVDTLISAEKELAERIIADEAPEPHWTHPRTRECLRILHGLEPGLQVALSDDGYERWLNVARRKNEIKEREEANLEDTNRILAEMRDAELALMPLGTKAIKRSVTRESLWTETDVWTAHEKLGQVKRKGFEQLREKKI